MRREQTLNIGWYNLLWIDCPHRSERAFRPMAVLGRLPGAIHLSLGGLFYYLAGSEGYSN